LLEEGPQLSRRPHEIPVADDGHLTHACARQHEMGSGDVRVRFGRLHGDAADEAGGGVFGVTELQEHAARARGSTEPHLPGALRVLGAELMPDVAVQATSAVLVRRLVEAHVLEIGDEGELYRVEYRRFAAAVVSEEEAAPSQLERLVLEVVPVD